MMKLFKYDSMSFLEAAMSESIIGVLEKDIAENNSATILVSGGTSPIALFKLLSLATIDWSKVTIGLVDERFVPNTHEKSNELLVKENFLINNAAKAKFIGMVNNSSDKELNLIQADKDYSIFKEKTNVCILGMGDDGHTASLFPNDNNSEENLKSNSESLNLLNTQAPVYPENRITCPKDLIMKSENLYLMISGEQKLEVLNSAKENKLPISYFGENENTKLSVFYAEKK